MKPVIAFWNLGARVLGIETEEVRAKRLLDEQRAKACVEMFDHATAALSDLKKTLTGSGKSHA